MAAATVAPPPAPLARGRPQKRATQARKPGPHPRRVRPAARAGMPRGAPHWCGQRFPLRWRRAVSGKGTGKEGRRRGRRAQRPGARYGRADDGGAGRGKRRKRKGERARADGAGRRGERARVEGGMQGPRKRSHDQGKAGVRGGGQREGSVGRCGRWMDARGRRTNGEERRPVGRKRRAPALQNDPAGARKKSALLLYKTTRRACAKKAHSCFTKRPGGRAQKSALLLYKTTQRACAKIARHCFAKRPGGRAQK